MVMKKPIFLQYPPADLAVKWPAIGIMATGAFAFSAARVYLVTEAFISVRDLPIGAYSSVSWAQFLPRIG